MNDSDYCQILFRLNNVRKIINTSLRRLIFILRVEHKLGITWIYLICVIN